MNFKTGYVKAGTHLCGWFDATRQQIESVLGEPTFFSSDFREKTTIEWQVTFDDGTVATIYDWKRYSKNPLGFDEVYRWHIGGLNVNAVRNVSKVLGIPATGQELVSY